MTVTNLTNTVWEFNDSLVKYSGATDTTYNINFVSNDTSCTAIVVTYSSNVVSYIRYTGGPGQYGEVYNKTSLWSSKTAYKRIRITGGADVEKSSLITFLETNAVLVYQPLGLIGNPLLVGVKKNFQVSDSFGRATTSSYSSVISVTCAKTGKYNVYWWGYRSSTSGTSGSALYVNDTIVGSAYTTFDSTLTNVQKVKVANVSLNKNDIVAVYARSRGSNYYMYVGNLTLEEL